jgi:hypothetical protein
VTDLIAALVSVALAALIVVAGCAATPPLLAAAVGLVVLVLAIGWAGLLGLPARLGSATMIVLTGWSAAALAVRATEMARPLAPFAALMAVSVLLAFGRELTRRDGRRDLVESVTGTLSGQALALLGGGWILVPTTRLALTALVVAVVAATASRLVAFMPLPPHVLGWAALVGGVVAGTAVGAVLDLARVLSLLLLAAAVAAVAAGLDRLVLTVARGRGVPAALSVGAVPLLAVGTMTYTVARLLA